MFTKKVLVLAGLGLAVLAGTLGYVSLARSAVADGGDNPIAILHTSAGDITFVLRADAAPKSAARFIDNAQRGVYDGVIFDCGCATMVRAGALLPDWSLKAMEVQQYEDRELDSPLGHHRGRVGVVDYGNVCDSHEFYICVNDELQRWDGRKSVFAEVVGGMEIVDAIAASGDEDHRPAFVVTITNVDIVGDVP